MRNERRLFEVKDFLGQLRDAPLLDPEDPPMTTTFDPGFSVQPAVEDWAHGREILLGTHKDRQGWWACLRADDIRFKGQMPWHSCGHGETPTEALTSLWARKVFNRPPRASDSFAPLPQEPTR